MKPRVLITPLSGKERTAWLNPSLARTLLKASHDSRAFVAVEIVEHAPVDFARNVCVDIARRGGYDYLIQLDNDQTFADIGPMDVLFEALQGERKDVIGMPYVQSLQQNGNCVRFNLGYEPLPVERQQTDGNFITVDRVATGCMILSRRVWTEILPKGPWFKWMTDTTNELLAPDPAIKGGEDYYLCHLLAERGAKVWMHRTPIGHLKAADITALASMAQGLSQAKAETK